MMPESLIKFGLDASLRDLCNYISQTGAVKVNYQSIGVAELEVEKNVAMHIYRIVQELLNNVLKHAAASEAVVQVAYSGGHFNITVEDNGEGFDTNRSFNGMGWNNIRNRVNSLKGSMDVQSVQQKGTSVFVEFNLAS
jgi:signal transduction histidine kinase